MDVTMLGMFDFLQRWVLKGLALVNGPGCLDNRIPRGSLFI